MTSRELLDQFLVTRPGPHVKEHNDVVKASARQYEQVHELAEWCITEQLESGVDVEAVWREVATARDLQDQMLNTYFKPVTTALKGGS